MSNLKSETVVSPSFSLATMFHELREHREMLYYFCWRDLKSRYKVIWVGIFWAFLQPIVSVAALTFVMTKMVKITPEGIPFPLFVFAGTLVWQFFSSVVLASYNAATSALRLVTKTYVPRLILPLNIQFLPLIDLCISSVLFCALIVYYNVPISSNAVFLPFYLGLGLLTTVGATFWCLTFSLAIQEIRLVIPTAISVLYVLTPVFYSSKAVPANLATFLYLNPLAASIEGIRWSLFALPEPSPDRIMISSLSCLLLVATGIFAFSKISGKVADLV